MKLIYEGNWYFAKVRNYIAKNHRVTGKELAQYFNNISSRAVRKQLKNLLEKNQLRKVGIPPKVWYLLDIKNKTPAVILVNKDSQTIINKRYYFISTAGEAQIGWEGSYKNLSRVHYNY